MNSHSPALGRVLICVLWLASSIVSPAQESLPEIVKRVSPATVIITTYDRDGDPIGQGTGFFISQSGDIITNRHVLLLADRAEVKTSGAKVFPISGIVAEDKDRDIVRAVVKIPAGGARPLMVSNEIAEVGERLFVIGNPLGLEQTVSDGIVSAVRDIPEIGKIYQITAPISSGSSGSPVVNMKGEVIGVATFQMVEGQNLNFAIPGERVNKLRRGPLRSLRAWSEEAFEEYLQNNLDKYLSDVSESSYLNFIAKPLYGTIALRADFYPDPRRIEINAGGPDPVDMGHDCIGYVNRSCPDVDLNYSAGDYDLFFYVESRADTILIVLDPDGVWHCNDDDPRRGLNPTMRISNPKSGNYNIWVGTVDKGEQKAVLYISEYGPKR